MHVTEQVLRNQTYGKQHLCGLQDFPKLQMTTLVFGIGNSRGKLQQITPIVLSLLEIAG